MFVRITQDGTSLPNILESARAPQPNYVFTFHIYHLYNCVTPTEGNEDCVFPKIKFH